MGANYRKEWATPVVMPVFNINKERGGFFITGLGGGMQTKSLLLEDSQCNIWALRMVDKDVDSLVPTGIRKSFLKKIVRNFIQDLVTAAHPYAALTIPILANAAGVETGTQQLFFVPDDPALGVYRQIFANQVCILEQRTVVANYSDTSDTDEVLEDVLLENKNRVLQQSVLKARLLDMLIADWDRHERQWKWASIATGETKQYFPIPRDRDQAFFHSGGFLVKAVIFFFFRHMKGFKRKSTGLTNMNMKSWEFDQFFLNELDKQHWQQLANEFRQNMTDSVIDHAVKQLPPEIAAISGENLAGKLRSRRDELPDNVMKYYSFLAVNVTVYGTAEAEYFHVFPEGDQIAVSVYNYIKGEKGRRIYHRSFDPGVTGYIYLTGLGAADHFTIDKNVKGIRLTIDGGTGQDVFNIDVNAKAIVKDIDQVHGW